MASNVGSGISAGMAIGVIIVLLVILLFGLTIIPVNAGHPIIEIWVR